MTNLQAIASDAYKKSFAHPLSASAQMQSSNDVALLTIGQLHYKSFGGLKKSMLARPQLYKFQFAAEDEG